MDSGSGSAPDLIVVQMEQYRFDLRMLLQEPFQCYGHHILPHGFEYAGKGQQRDLSPIASCYLQERGVAHGVDRRFKQVDGFCFWVIGQKERIAFITPCRFALELAECAAHCCIFWRSAVIEADKHGIVVFFRFVERASGNAIVYDFRVNASFGQIRFHDIVLNFVVLELQYSEIRRFFALVSGYAVIVMVFSQFLV